MNMMLHFYKTVVVVSIFIFSCLPGFSQSDFHTEKPNAFLSMAGSTSCRSCYYNYYVYLSRLLENKFNYSRNHVLKLVPIIKKEGTGMIEGMESVKLEKISYELLLINRLTNDKARWKKSFDLKNTPGEGQERIEELTDSFLSDTTIQTEILGFIDNYLQKEFLEHCQKYMDAAEAKRQKGDLKKAITILSYIDERSDCAENKNQLIKSCLNERAIKICQNQMQKAKILANSPEVGDVREAIQILLGISPDAPCAQEAIELSNNIGEKDYSSNDSEKLKQQLVIWQSQSSMDWYQGMFRKIID